MRLAAALARFWAVRGYLQEGREWLEELLAGADAGTIDPEVRAAALFGVGALAIYQGLYHDAVTALDASLALRREQDDPAAPASTLHLLGNALVEQGDHDRASALYRECLALRRDRADVWGVSSVLNSMAIGTQYAGDYRAALSLLDESLTIKRTGEDARMRHCPGERGEQPGPPG